MNWTILIGLNKTNRYNAKSIILLHFIITKKNVLCFHDTRRVSSTLNPVPIVIVHSASSFSRCSLSRIFTWFWGCSWSRILTRSFESHFYLARISVRINLNEHFKTVLSPTQFTIFTFSLAKSCRFSWRLSVLQTAVVVRRTVFRNCPSGRSISNSIFVDKIAWKQKVHLLIYRYLTTIFLPTFSIVNYDLNWENWSS